MTKIRKTLVLIEQEEIKIQEAENGVLHMIDFLKKILDEVKSNVLEHGFDSREEEIYFFKFIKPQILAKLIYYNKVYRIESASPATSGKTYIEYVNKQLQEIKTEYRKHIKHSGFYRYYRSGRKDLDERFFTLGNINIYDGLNSFVFEVDEQFSTYYDFKVARIIANELLSDYLIDKTERMDGSDFISQFSNEINWTDNKSALIELIYALHASGVISNGNLGIRKLAQILQVLFNTSLGDIHHAFHRMKTRAGSRTAFLDHLKDALEEYMDKGL